jgi:hypothetical protein
MKTQRLTIDIMGPDKAGNGGVKITERGKRLKWYWHNRRTVMGMTKLKGQIIRAIKSVHGVS